MALDCGRYDMGRTSSSYSPFMLSEVHHHSLVFRKSLSYVLVRPSLISHQYMLECRENDYIYIYIYIYMVSV